MTVDPDAFVHQTAVVDDGATIGADTKVWHFCHVMPDAVIGSGCTLGQNVFVADNVKVGDGVKVQNNVSLYEGVILEDDVFCGPSMVFTNDLNPRSPFPKGSENYVETYVEQGATIGANATIVCGIRLGAWCFVGAGAVVAEDVPAHALMVGVPARQAGWMCACGERLPAPTSDGSTACEACQRAYSLTEDGGLEPDKTVKPG